MKFSVTFIFCCTAIAASAQTLYFHPTLWDQPLPGKELTIVKTPQSYYGSFYSFTGVYNDMFKMPEGDDEFILPATSGYYKEKRVAKVTISKTNGTPQLILDLNSNGQVTKTTRFTELLREDEYFYDEKGRISVMVKNYGRNDILLRQDSIKYIRQRKIIHDTVYEYTTIYTTIYKSGAFLNEQNQWYNKTYHLKEMGFAGSIPVYILSKNGKKTKATTIYQYEKFACNYTPTRLYFSCQQIDLSDCKFLANQNPVSPDEKALQTHVPELYLRDKPQYSDLPCEQFQEPSFMRTRMTCGYGMQHAGEYDQVQFNINYVTSQNSNNLQDTCYTNYGGSKSPKYYFTYAYFE